MQSEENDAKSNLIKNLAIALSLPKTNTNSTTGGSSSGQAHTNSDESQRQQDIVNGLMSMFEQQIPPPKVYLRLLLTYFEQYYYNTSPNIIHIQRAMQEGVAIGNVNVVGDVHGQYKDFLQIFQGCVGGSYPSNLNRYIFNGDIVDRGFYSVEILTLLLTWKLFDENSVYILRGNHEDSAMTKVYGFKDEIMHKYSQDESIYNLFINLFTVLPIAAVIEHQVFVVHGGLCDRTYKLTIAELNYRFNRMHESISDNHGFHGLLWRDPRDIEGEFELRQGRGNARNQVFGHKATEHFLNINKLKLLIRSHECVNGIAFHHNRKCITVFSAPNYHGNRGNSGAIVRFEARMPLQPNYVYFYANRRIGSSNYKPRSRTEGESLLKASLKDFWIDNSELIAIGDFDAVISQALTPIQSSLAPVIMSKHGMGVIRRKSANTVVWSSTNLSFSVIRKFLRQCCSC